MSRTEIATKSLRIAVDIGGTFTDLAAFDDRSENLFFGKALSTHNLLVDGIMTCAEGARVEFADAYIFLHGSTIAINTLLERTGADTALFVTEGFRDIYEIGRINRPDAYNLFFVKHRPLVSRSKILEVTERILADGSVLTKLDEQKVRDFARTLRSRDITAVAILLLHSYRSPAHERRVKEIIMQELPDAFVTASHELTQEYREFERVSTVVANAYIGPRVSAYLDDIQKQLGNQKFNGDFYVVQSTGGLFTIEEARTQCVRMLESGPAAGVIGTAALCRQMEMPNAIAFDMGGTTAKAGVVLDYVPLTTSHALIGSYDRALPIQVPMIDVFEVGTGGGSIASLAEGKALRVGPGSAGSTPGPACYGRGGKEPTVTDANLLLGRLDAGHFLGGEMALDVEAAELAMNARVAQPLGLTSTEAADGILRIAATAMSYAVKGVTTDRGLDAGSFAMVTYGGAGPLHASAVAREIGIRRVIIPFSPGHFSAFGMLFSDLRYDYVTSCFRKLDDLDFDELEGLYADMENRGRCALSKSSALSEGCEIIRYADMRYIGQEHAVTVELQSALFTRSGRAAIKQAFDKEHRQRYSTSAPLEPAEIVSVRSTVLGLLRKPDRTRMPRGEAQPSPDAIVRRKQAFFRGCGFVETPVYARDRLLGGNEIAGPALIEEHASTTVLYPGDRLFVDAFGNLDIKIGEGQ